MCDSLNNDSADLSPDQPGQVESVCRYVVMSLYWYAVYVNLLVCMFSRMAGCLEYYTSMSLVGLHIAMSSYHSAIFTMFLFVSVSICASFLCVLFSVPEFIF